MNETPIAKLLRASIDMAQMKEEIAEKDALIQRQRKAYALVHERLALANLKLLRARMDFDETPALLRRQAT